MASKRCGTCITVHVINFTWRRVFNRIENKENTLDQLPRNMPSLVELFCCILYWRAAWIIFFGTVAPLKLFGVILFRGLAFSLRIMETIAK